MEVKQKKLDKSQIELEFELTAEEFKEHFNHAIEHLKHHVKVDGFREGKAPASMVEEKLKPEMLLMEAGDHAVQHVYTDYIKEQKEHHQQKSFYEELRNLLIESSITFEDKYII